MTIKNWFAGAAAVAALAFGMQTANAAVICTGCEYIFGEEATYLGSYNPDTFDLGTFNHTALLSNVGPSADFSDFWVFDLNPAGSGSISADFTSNTGILNFQGTLWTDGGSTCSATAGAACSTLVPGAILTSVAGSDRRWEIFANGLSAGRYIIQVTGTTRATGGSAYSGQLSFVPEPGTLALLGLGLIGMGFTARRRRV